MASFFATLKMLRKVKDGLDKAKDLKDGSKWRASHNGKVIGPVKEVNAGLRDLDLAIRVDFEENGKTRQIRAEHGLFNRRDEIKLDGKEVDLDDLIISPTLDQEPKRVVIEYKFTLDGASHHYKFQTKEISG